MKASTMVISDLANSEAALLEQLRLVTAERDSYLLAWHVAVHDSHASYREAESLRRQLSHLRTELRRLRGSSLREDAA